MAAARASPLYPADRARGHPADPSTLPVGVARLGVAQRCGPPQARCASRNLEL